AGSRARTSAIRSSPQLGRDSSEPARAQARRRAATFNHGRKTSAPRVQSHSLAPAEARPRATRPDRFGDLYGPSLVVARTRRVACARVRGHKNGPECEAPEVRKLRSRKLRLPKIALV